MQDITIDTKADDGTDTAQDYLEQVIKNLRKLSNERKGEILGVLEYLSIYLRRTREEVSTLRHSNKGVVLIASSADELEEILTETAKAANEFMGAAESIETIAAKVEVPEHTEALMNEVTRIYEASSFQDITGQRITKVVRALQHIEKRIVALADACGDTATHSPPPPASERSGDAALLNGPQLAKTANSQSEIDRLFEG